MQSLFYYLITFKLAELNMFTSAFYKPAKEWNF